MHSAGLVRPNDGEHLIDDRCHGVVLEVLGSLASSMTDQVDEHRRAGSSNTVDERGHCRSIAGETMECNEEIAFAGEVGAVDPHAVGRGDERSRCLRGRIVGH